MAHAERRNRDIDWVAVERDYRSGALSLRQMGAKHDCSHSTIANFAGRHGWSRVRQTPGGNEPWICPRTS